MAKQQIVRSLAEKVEKLVAENDRLERSRVQLTEELVKARLDNRQLRERLDAAQKRVAMLELGEGLGGTKDSASRKRARAQVNRLMREIDKCLELMNN